MERANGAAKAGVEITGISDPQNQDGGSAASSGKAAITQIGSGNDPMAMLMDVTTIAGKRFVISGHAKREAGIFGA